MRFPGPLGGMLLRSILDSADASYLSTWVSLKDRVSTLCNLLGRPSRVTVDEEWAARAKQNLMDKGVEVSFDGAVCFSNEAQQRYNDSPWAADLSIEELFTMPGSRHFQEDEAQCQEAPIAAPRHKLHSRIMRGIEALAAARLWEGFSEHRRECLLSSGGPKAGSFWQVTPDSSKCFMDNAHWRTAVRQRLGVLTAPDGAMCHLPKGDDQDEKCGHSLDADLHHPLLCKVGPARMRPHRAVASALKHLLKSSGAHVDIERAWPPLYEWSGDRCKEAVMDLVVHWPGSCTSFLVDVTIRCPHASRYTHACTKAGVAAAAGTKDKLDRYGDSVLTLAFETYGRLGDSGRVALDVLLSEAGLCAHDRWASQCLGPRWRLTLERALLFAQADIVLLSLGHHSETCIRRVGRRML